ncbi:ParA family protein [Quisquiliibacterium transsilvanicum]|uniref:Chromosome partitioning protein n=1 Tax=Quisquiliibacterium transsilvanicum TaxID=1549638 RepID=A0A7W8HF38_9BURK|nr:ParA family protein [Quisquiliibacterium transsilvanicum]MBB5270947.1 chromosome partitioning protein [Quisquiliibacterium transsilvanicum]
MPVVAVVNPKGGVGKTTLATNLAGAFAAQGHRTMLGDLDRQQSSRDWLSLRPEGLAPIEGWDEAGEGGLRRPPAGVTHVVLDTPAQIEASRLAEVLKLADRVLLPMQPSMLDVLAMQRFLRELERALRGRARLHGRVGVVGMRVDARTRAAEELERFLAGLGLPVVATLRDTQNYVQLTAHGLTLFDLPPQRVERDLQSWEPLLRWL